MRTFEATPAGMRAVLATNLIGLFLLCQALIPLMRGAAGWSTSVRHGPA